MNRYKKIVILLISLTLIFTLTACKGKEVNKQVEKLESEDTAYTEKEVLKEVQKLGDNGKGYTMETYEYDEYGNLIESWDMSNDDFMEELVNYEYDDKNQLIKKVVETADGYIKTEKYEYDKRGNMLREIDMRKQNGEFLAKFEQNMKYNGQDKLIELKLYRNDKLIHTEKYDYDENGNKILEKKSGKDALSGEKYCEWNEWKYNDNGKLLEKLIKDKEGVITYGERYEYTEDGKEKKVTYLKENGEINDIYIRFYNKEGVWIKSVFKLPSGKILSKMKRTYDKKGNLIKWTKEKDGQIKIIDKYKYDDEGNRIKTVVMKVKNGKKLIDRIRKYRYNKYGNIIFELRTNKDGVELLRKTQEFYDKDKRKSYKSIVKHENGEISGIYEEHFDRKGNLIKEVEKSDYNNPVIDIDNEYKYIYKKIKVKKGENRNGTSINN